MVRTICDRLGTAGGQPSCNSAGGEHYEKDLVKNLVELDQNYAKFIMVTLTPTLTRTLTLSLTLTLILTLTLVLT